MDGYAAPRPRLRLPRRSLHAASDERLVAQIRGRDPAASRSAFEALYDRHHRGILTFCRHMLGSLEEAEDAVQHTFSAAYRSLLADDRDIAVKAWLYTIARNRCLSMLAARREHVALDNVEAVLPSTAGLAREVEQRDDLRALLDDLARLPEDQRAALVLAELEAHSHAEIADILGVPTAKVKALVFQARESLMIRRQARETDCATIREQLSSLRGGALRRRELRRHVESCPGCTAFEAEVRRQRAQMALVLPVAPTLALKHSTLAAAFAATGTGAGAGAVAGGGGIMAGGGLALGAKATGTKALAVLAVTATAGSGAVAVKEVTQDAPAPPAHSAPARGVPATAPAATTPAGVTPAAPGTAPASPSSERAKERLAGKAARKRGGRPPSTAPGNGRAVPAGAAATSPGRRDTAQSKAKAKARANQAAAAARRRARAEARARAAARASQLRAAARARAEAARKRAAREAAESPRTGPSHRAPATAPATDEGASAPVTPTPAAGGENRSTR